MFAALLFDSRQYDFHFFKTSNNNIVTWITMSYKKGLKLYTELHLKLSYWSLELLVQIAQYKLSIIHLREINFGTVNFWNQFVWQAFWMKCNVDEHINLFLF